MDIGSDEMTLFRDMARRAFEQEIAPHFEDWEEAHLVPRELWNTLGAAGLLCPDVDEAYGGAGTTSARHPDADRGAVAHGLWRGRHRLRHPLEHRGPLHQPPRHRGAEAAVAAAHGQRRGLRCPGHDRARRRLGRAGHPHQCGPRRRRVGPERLEDLHHQRHPRGPGGGRGHHGPGQGRQGHLAVPRRRQPPRLREEHARSRRSASTPPTRHSCSSRTFACPPTPCSARRTAVSSS
jgi:hypothetical protein